MRALLDLMHENEARVQKWATACAAVLGLARQYLTILDPEVGDKVLIQAVEAALANLRILQALTGRMVPLSTLRLGPGSGWWATGWNG